VANDKLFEYLHVKNFFDEGELKAIWEEIELSYGSSLWQPDNLGVGSDSPKELASKLGFFASRYDRVFSHKTYKATSKIFNGYTYNFASLSFPNRPILLTTNHALLYSLYTDGGFYKQHDDACITTALFWLCREPKRFTGGDLYFADIDETVEFENNSMLLFPGQAQHEVSPVSMPKDCDPLDGRICLTLFLT